MDWTEAARAELERYLETIRIEVSKQEDSGDPDEVTEDMRRHVYEELASRGTEVVTTEALSPVLSTLGSPPLGASPEPKAEPRIPQRRPRGRAFFMSLVGLSILLSFATFLVEATSHMCAEAFFDPMPTLWHGLLVLLVPTSQVVLLLVSDVDNLAKRRWLGVLSGMGIGISLYYALMFLPLLPLAVVGLVVGLGLLPLSPFFAFMTSVYVHRRLRRMTTDGAPVRIPTLWLGFAAGLLALPLAGLSSILTNYGMQVASSEDPEESARGIAFLRSFGSERQLLHNCYTPISEQHDPISNLMRVMSAVQPDQARKIYYRVTGDPFNAVEPPRRWRNDWMTAPNLTWTEWKELGGTEVASRNSQLSLIESRIDGKIEVQELTAYTEWTMKFRNLSLAQREARAQVLLPPGGVVSRLTLWVDGEEREAAFAGRSETRAAYQSVVQTRRDPVLVTTSGPNRVLMQCFPVQPSGGEMQVRIGVTSPLVLNPDGSASYVLPAFTERNFQVPDTTTHAVWIESTRAFLTGTTGLRLEEPDGDAFTARGELDEATLAAPGASLKVTLPDEISDCRTDNTFQTGTEIIQRVKSTPNQGPRRVVIVLDGSAPMDRYAESLATALAEFPAGIELGLIFAGDSPEEAFAPVSANQEVLADAAKFVRRHSFVGGGDMVPALVEAWERCAEVDDSLVLALHGAQPVALSPSAPLTQRLERRSGGPRIAWLRTGPGPNQLVRELDGHNAIQVLPRTSSLESDLTRLFTQWNATEIDTIEREVVSATQAEPARPSQSASRHVARLWAFHSIREQRLAGERGWRDEALLLAAHYQLVTPVSGAVVLETDEQFKRAGLEPGDPATIPSVPEPETFLLLAISLLLLMFAWRRRKAFA